MQVSIVFLVRVQCRRKESSRSLSSPDEFLVILELKTCMGGRVSLSQPQIWQGSRPIPAPDFHVDGKLHGAVQWPAHFCVDGCC